MTVYSYIISIEEQDWRIKFHFRIHKLYKCILRDFLSVHISSLFKSYNGKDNAANVPKHHAICVYRRCGDMAPSILDLDTKWKSSAYMIQSLY